MSCRTTRNVISDGRPLVWTSALLIRGDLRYFKTFLHTLYWQCLSVSCRTSQNVISDGRLLVRISTLLIQCDLCPWRTLLCSHDPNRLGHSLMWVPLMVFFPPHTALVIGLGFRPNIDVNNELLGSISLQYLINNTTN